MFYQTDKFGNKLIPGLICAFHNRRNGLMIGIYHKSVYGRKTSNGDYARFLIDKNKYITVKAKNVIAIYEPLSKTPVGDKIKELTKEYYK